MDSDEETTIAGPDDAAWVATQRQWVIDYLGREHVDHGGVSLEPRWFLSPYVAIWAIRSKRNPDYVGWWAISGDLPTDYMTCTNEQDEADVLLAFSREWKAAAAEMFKGRHPPGTQIGPPGKEKELAPLLLKRAELLEKFANQIKTNGPDDDSSTQSADPA